MKWIVIMALLAAGGYFGWSKYGKQLSATNPTGVASRTKTAVVEERDIRFSVSAAGEIGPAEQVSVKPEINGRIEQLPVDLGDKVKKGAILFSLDDKELQNQRSSMLTEIERANLQLQQAERNYKRSQQLFADDLMALELYENAKTEFDLARNAVERAQRELAILEERLTKTKIEAPFDCTILTRPVSIGQAVSGSGGFNSGTEVLTIADLNSMIINAHINQADITRLTVDKEVEVQVEAVPGLKITGKVERIAPQATIKNNIKGFAVRILLTNVDEQVRPGMTANIKIPVAAAEGVLAVPLAAVFTEKNPDTGRSERFVYVKNGESYERRPVQVGISDFFFAEIQNGLQPGDVVSLEQPKAEQDKGGGKLIQAARQSSGSSSPASSSKAVPAAASSPAKNGGPAPSKAPAPDRRPNT
ncbi:MAG: efflux RND transporter periplasmic adaptor subunit [Verrucomicrobiota bacterium]|nr:efflux RND transporter periplasmic adaptor subunit [Verrucomicrobiota bacterium]